MIAEAYSLLPLLGERLQRTQYVFQLPICTYTYVLRECEWRTKQEWKEYLLGIPAFLHPTLVLHFFFQVSLHWNEKISLEFKLVQQTKQDS